VFVVVTDGWRLYLAIGGMTIAIIGLLSTWHPARVTASDLVNLARRATGTLRSPYRAEAWKSIDTDATGPHHRVTVISLFGAPEHAGPYVCEVTRGGELVYSKSVNWERDVPLPQPLVKTDGDRFEARWVNPEGTFLASVRFRTLHGWPDEAPTLGSRAWRWLQRYRQTPIERDP
jgi:hypothetical protein